MDELQKWANWADIASFLVGVISLMFAVITWIFPVLPPELFRRVSPWLPYVVAVGFIFLGFWVNSLLFSVLSPELFRRVSPWLPYVVAVGFIFLGFWVNSLLFKPVSHNRLIAYHDFEGRDEGWSRISSHELASDKTIRSRFPEDSFFPGFMQSEVTEEYALTGQRSLKVTTSVNTAGDYKSFLYRRGTITGNGITIYVFTPDLTNISIAYIQLCVPSHDWVCSSGTKLVPKEWTPITIDLSQTDKDGISLSSQQLTELAVQWRFQARAASSLSLYFDAVEIFYPGP